MVVHGRWNYRRLSKCILYSFYKNIVLTFMLFFFAFFSAFSGMSLFDDMVYSGYNFFLGMPPLLIGMFDRDMSSRTVLRFNKVYMSGKDRMDLNIPTLTSWMVQGVLDAIVIFFLTYCVVGFTADGLYIFGTTCYSCLILSMMYRAASSTYSWNFVTFFFWFGSLILFGGIFMPIYSNWYDYAPQFYGVAAKMVANSAFWLIMFLVPSTVLLVDFTKKLFRSMYFHTPIDHAMEVDRGITHDTKEMINVYEGDSHTVRSLLSKKGEQDDQGMHKWWMTFNSRLPKFKFDRKKLRMMNKHLDAKSMRDLGIVDTEKDKQAVSGFAFDHIGRDIGVGGRGSMYRPSLTDAGDRTDAHSSERIMSSEREHSGDGMAASLRNLGLGEKTDI